jgi:hypothetical protein
VSRRAVPALASPGVFLTGFFVLTDVKISVFDSAPNDKVASSATYRDKQRSCLAVT